ncbi:MAG: (Fe-S)-binding protein [Candidatus Heimdallarchaeota archaeon]|nr:MAG: (Fe-S)-binding protein [Candidatus Heimdallarchaeota archaeon]
MRTIPRNNSLFKESVCTRCGECFHYCPELRLSLKIAKQEIENLIEGKVSHYVLLHCTTCFSCNLYCPNDCKPYQLILERWNDLYKQRGAPPIYRFVCPTIEHNLWQMLQVFMSSEEYLLINRWMNQIPKDSILLIGNYLHLLPFVFGNSKLLDNFTPVDLLDHWECGGYLYQGGYLDVVKHIAEKCKQDFNMWKVKEIVPALDAVHWMLTAVHPNEMGVLHNCEVVNFHELLLKKIKKSEIIFQNNLKRVVTVHDNCFSKAGDGRYWDSPRQILKLSGCKIVEMEHNRKDSLCCGFGSGASWNNPFRIVFDIMAVSKRKFQEAEATKADALITYCGGCLYLLWASRELFGNKIDVFHIIEIVRMSMGETIYYPEPHVRRAWDLITIINYHLLMSLLRKPFWIDKISLDEKILESKRYLGLRILRKLFDVPIIRILYRKGFRIVLPKMVTPRKF